MLCLGALLVLLYKHLLLNSLAEQVTSAVITIAGTSSSSSTDTSTDPASTATSVVSTEKAAQEGSIGRVG